ncbi:hypothetical protein LTR92_011655 [Exophiala xenobiotica]|nr:hypothetical protein LTR92_011655 [Exophiala xenobiotica]
MSDNPKDHPSKRPQANTPAAATADKKPPAQNRDGKSPTSDRSNTSWTAPFEDNARRSMGFSSNEKK